MPSQYAQRIEEIAKIAAENQVSLAKLLALMETMPERCPYREDIARARNNHQRLRRVEEIVQNNRMKIALFFGAGGLGGLAVGLIQYLIEKRP